MKKNKLYRKIHDKALIAVTIVAAIIALFGAMGLDGEKPVECFLALTGSVAWLAAFFYANAERYGVWAVKR